MSLLGIAGTLAAVGAGYADAKSAKARRARQDKYDAATDRILASQEARMSKSEDLNDRFRGTTAGGPTDDEIMANQKDMAEAYARGGMIGVSNPCGFVDHTWMRASFKK
jgi:hypothetical protein